MGKSLNIKRIVLEIWTLLMVVLLGLEWINALPSFTDTESSFLWYFSYPLIILLVIYRVLPWKWIRPVVALAFIVVWYQRTMWTELSFFSSGWIKNTFTLVLGSMPNIIRMNFIEIDAMIRTGLFYLLIWLAVYILYRRVFVERKVLGTFIITIIYLSVLDTFFLFEGKWPIIRVFGYGFTLLALMNLHRIEGLIQRRVTHLKLMPWFLTAVLVLGSVSLIGYAVPKGGPNWPDPVEFLSSMKGSGEGGSSGTAQSGYGNSDARLGGSFVLTDNIIFESVLTGERYPGHYWRGESKELYTGHGWETDFTVEEPYSLSGVSQYRLIQSNINTEISESVQFYESTNLVFTSGQIQSLVPKIVFDITNPGSPLQSTINPETYRIEINGMFGSYIANSLIPSIDELLLMNISNKYNDSTENYPEEIMQVYTQLPENLPERIGRLAGEITKNETNIYQKVKNIERYLRWSGLQYRTTDIPYPEEGQDFVDQFLFETRRGYCDHFSTAMVVMLRTQGIPARWVKGYTFGEFESLDANTHKVTVRGKNAHSWVEVYFPEVGWVPFEPTSSFNYPFEIIRNTAIEDTEPEAIVTPSLNELLQEEIQKERTQASSGNQPETQGAMNQAKPWVIVGIVLLLAGVLVYFFREPIIFRLHTIALARESDSRLVYKSYQLIMKGLGKLFGVRKDDQTIREYITDVKWNRHGKEELQQITKAFEETRYGEKEPSIPRNELIAIVQRLLKRLRS